jgi:hypothetical protein
MVRTDSVQLAVGTVELTQVVVAEVDNTVAKADLE